MRVSVLDSSLEPLFWEHVNRDIPDHYFFIAEMKRNRTSTEIWLALDVKDHIEGMMMVYRSMRVQLRGSVEAVKTLLEKLTLEKADIQAQLEHEALIFSRYKDVKKASEIIVMTLRKGQENLLVKYPIVKLGSEDADQIATMMRLENPSWWGDTTAEQIASLMERNLWLGVRVDGRVVSAGVATVDDWASNIGAVVTDEGYRNRGFATSIVSALVDKILRKSNLCLIHVESDNKPAERVYGKVGFKPYKRYLLAKVGKQ